MDSLKIIKNDINKFSNTIISNVSKSLDTQRQTGGTNFINFWLNCDQKMFINICNGRRDKKRNPWLLPKPRTNKATVHESSITTNILQYLPYYKGKSYNLVWNNGTADYNDLMYHVYGLGIQYLLTNPKTQHETQLLLANNYYYAKSLSKFNSHIEFKPTPIDPNLSIEDQIQSYEQNQWEKDLNEYELIDSYTDYTEAEFSAIIDSYDLIRTNFISAHKTFFENLVTFKLNTNLIKFFNNQLLSIIQSYNKEHDTSYIIKTMDNIYELITQPNRDLPANPSSKLKEKYQKNTEQLLKEGQTYINLLIKRQLLLFKK
ncbi:unknown [Lactobacillus amylovorus CAG:719]|mgnify:CR=1 FL=1|nr:unknown [Lactobacillus amylovorus CAG:719]